jgi:exosortase A
MMLPSISLEAGPSLVSREVATTLRSTSSWRNASSVLGCCLVLLVVFHRATVASILETWSRDPFAHAYFVVAAAAYLAWSRRERVESMIPRPTFVALPLLGFLSFLWLLGNLTSTALVQQSCLAGMFVALTWAVLGTAAVRALVFPLGLLLFALPFGERIAPTLQEFTARFALQMLTLSGLHPVLEGHVISIADSRWQVTESCGGINYVVASLAVGYLYAGAVYRQWGHRVAFLGASAIVPLAANGLRVYTTILLDYLGATRVVSGMGHYLYGMFVFGIVMSVLFITCGRWREEPTSGDGPTSSPQRVAAVASPVSARRTALCAMVGMLLVAIGPVSASMLRHARGAEGAIQQNPPVVSMPWKAVDENSLAWSPRFVAPQSEFLQTYTSGDHVVKLYLARYGANQPDAKLTSRTNLLYDKPWWSAGGRHRTIVVEGRSFQVNETFLQSPQSSLLVWNWYQIDRGFTGNDYMAKLLFAKARLFRSREDAAAIAVATDGQPGVEAAAVLLAFVEHLSLRTLEP